MNKPIIYYDRRGPSGNIYHILGMVSQALRKQRRYTDFNNLRDRVFEVKSYDEALSILEDAVTLIDINK